MARTPRFAPWFGSPGVVAWTTPVAPVVPGPPQSFWDEGYFDFRSLTDLPTRTLTSSLASTVGANTLLPVNAPEVSNVACAGGKGAHLLGSSSQHFRFDIGAASLSGSDKLNTIAVRFRQDKVGQRTIVGFGNSAGQADNYLQIQSVGEKIVITKKAAAEAAVVRTGTTNIGYGWHDLVVVFLGTTFFVILDGVLETFDSNALDTLSVTMDRGAVGSFVSSGPLSTGDMYIQFFAKSSGTLTQAEAIAFTTGLRLADFEVLANRPRILWQGDSLQNGQSDELRAAGERGYAGDHDLNNGYSVEYVGAYLGGSVWNRLGSAFAGQSIAAIQAQTISDLNAYSNVREIHIMAGAGDINAMAIAGGSTAAVFGATCRDRLVTMLNVIAPVLSSTNPSAKIFLYTQPPRDRTADATGDDIVSAYNPLHAAVVSAWNAANPSLPPIVLVDIHTGPMATWALSYFHGAGDPHPSALGCKFFFDTAMTAGLGTYRRSYSATVKPLECYVVGPIAGTTVTQGVAQTVTVWASRTEVAIDVKLDGVSLGAAATVLDSTTYGGCERTYTWTPTAPQVGAGRLLTATVTDSISGATATSPSVSTTVAAVSYTPADEGNAIGKWDVSNVAGRTVDGSNNCTAIVNLISGISASEATNPPAYQATGGPGGTQPCVKFDGVNDQLISASDTTVGVGTSGINHSATFVLVAKVTSAGKSGAFFSLGRSGDANMLQGFGQISSGQYRIYKNPDSNAGTVNQQSVSALTTFAILQVTYDGTAKTITTRVDNGTPQTVACDQTTFTIQRWAFGAAACTFPSTLGFGDYSLCEAWLFSDAKIGQAPSGGKDAMDRIFNSLNTKWGLGLTAR